MSDNRFFSSPDSGSGQTTAPARPAGDGVADSLPVSTQSDVAVDANGAESFIPAVTKAVATQSEAYANIQDRVVQALLRKSVVTAEQVSEASSSHKSQQSKGPLWRTLAEVASVERDAVYKQAAVTYAFRIAPVAEREPESEFVKTVLESFSEDNRNKLLDLRVAPYAYAQDQPSGILKLVFITEDPMRQDLQRTMHALDLERFELCYAPGETVKSVLDEAFPRKNEFLERLQESTGPDFDFGMSFEQEESGLIDEEALEAEISRSSLINLVEAILVESVRMGASDVHVYPNAQRKTEIHFRIDGKLQHWHTEEKGHPEALLAVLKDTAGGVDRFERDTAQDGFIQRRIDDTLIRYRFSVLPISTANTELRAESIVLRVLDDRKVITDLSKLGLLEGALEQFDKAIRQPHGMVILTGPTGSGKSTTLVASLSQVVTPEVNVLTVEDPVEYIIPGVRQIKLSHKFNFEQALRSILRHDPDIVMVGEMRDKVTAELAIKLANTGHLTFSTLHTNDAPSAVSRLFKMGIEPFLIAYAINLVVAQRLIRTLCPECKAKDCEVDEVLATQLGFSEEDLAGDTFCIPNTNSSCPTCKGRGYKGRRAIAEALYFSPAIREAIVEAGDVIEEDNLRRIAEREGMLTLQASARVLVTRGETSLTEMLRVTAGDD
ncbi:MAG: type II/IV secretion system protein [Bacteroidetes bacterium]|nr:type II/IV secretion system protein [Bacteroidota bacterium]